jgi:hypothetical protein
MLSPDVPKMPSDMDAETQVVEHPWPELSDAGPRPVRQGGRCCARPRLIASAFWCDLSAPFVLTRHARGLAGT